MKVLLLGDVHGHLPGTDRPTWEFLAELVNASPWPCLQAGDIGRYPPLSRPLHFVFGNNDWPPTPRSENYVNLRAGEPIVLAAGAERLKVAGLNGVYDPLYYGRPELVPPAERDLYFTPAHVAACRRLEGVDIFLAHGVPAGFGRGRSAPVFRLRPRPSLCLPDRPQNGRNPHRPAGAQAGVLHLGYRLGRADPCSDGELPRC